MNGIATQSLEGESADNRLPAERVDLKITADISP
jgi:hypothetical protein